MLQTWQREVSESANPWIRLVTANESGRGDGSVVELDRATYWCTRFLLVSYSEKVTKTTVTVLLERIIRDRRRSRAIVKRVSPQRGDGSSLWWEERKRKSGVTCGGSEVGGARVRVLISVFVSLSSVPRCSVRSLVSRVFARGGKRDRESQEKTGKRTRGREIECRSERRVYAREREREGEGVVRERERERGSVYMCVWEKERARGRKREGEKEWVRAQSGETIDGT